MVKNTKNTRNTKKTDITDITKRRLSPKGAEGLTEYAMEKNKTEEIKQFGGNLFPYGFFFILFVSPLYKGEKQKRIQKT